MARAARARFQHLGVPPLGYLGRLSSVPPVWLESRAFMEAVRLRQDPVYAGAGLPRGTGQPVVLIPGFMAGDGSLRTLKEWLMGLGYQAETSGITLNIQYSEAALRTLVVRLVDLYGWAGQRVTLVGHSRGGLLAKVASHRHPELVERVVTLGSPLADPFDVHPLTMLSVRVAQAFNLVAYRQTGSVERRFLRDLEAPARVPVLSIYTRTDGIVHWTACVRPDVTCLEVTGSHSGLAVNPGVYAALGRVLAEPGPRRRRRRAGGA